MALCSVLKFGVGIGNDVSRLAAAIGVVTAGCVDLQHIAVRCGIRSATINLLYNYHTTLFTSFKSRNATLIDLQ